MTAVPDKIVNKGYTAFKNIIFILLYPIIFFLNIFKIKFCEIDHKFGQTLRFTEGFMVARKYYDFKELKNCRIIFLLELNKCNSQMTTMIKRNLKIFNFNFLFKLIVRMLYYWDKKDLILEMNNYAIKILLLRSDKNPYDFHKENFLKLSNDEIKKGYKILEQFNIKPNDKWICIANRDENYKNIKFPNWNWKYHNYRNFSVESLKESAEYFASKGYYVFRMGYLMKEKLNTKNKKIIDYANSEIRNDFLDVFLLAKCAFYFGGDTGISDVAFHFRRPTYGINFSSTAIDNGRSHTPFLFTFKRIKSLTTGKLLSLSDILNSKFAFTARYEDFIKNNVAPIENSSDELRSFAIEAEKDNNGENYESSFDLKNQQKFWDIYFKKVPKERMGQIMPKVSPIFLRKNMDLLN